MKKVLYSITIILLISSSTVFAKDYINATDIQKVSFGDTFENVKKKLGEPQQVLSKELTPDGKEQVIWQYETIKPPTNLIPFVTKNSQGQLADQSIYQQQRANNPPYLIIFINGKMSKIQRQKIEPNTNKPLDVVVY